jgi:hypothetical protein
VNKLCKLGQGVFELFDETNQEYPSYNFTNLIQMNNQWFGKVEDSPAKS